MPVLVHPDPRSVLGGLAATVYGNPSQHLRVIGVTGTSGKTTTTYLVEAGLRAADRVAGLIGTVGIRIAGEDLPSALTTPEAPDLQALLALMVEQGVDTVVMEVSSHALSLGRVDGVDFAVGGFTNLSRDHLDFHPTMEDYFDAKARLFDARIPNARSRFGGVRRRRRGPRDGRARIQPGDGQRDRPRPPTGASRTSARSIGGAQEFFAVDPAGVHHGLRIGLPGRYNVANCLLAAALLDAVGVSPEQAAPGLRDARVPGRLEPVDRGQDFLALVDYAHKPGALRAVLETLREQTTGRVAVVFGAGGNRDPGKREPMGQVAAELADLVVVTDDNPRDEDPAAIRSAIVAGAAGGRAQVVEIGDRREAIDHAVAWARAGDVVLIAGQGPRGRPDQPRADPAVRRPRRARRIARGVGITAHDRSDPRPDRRHRRRRARRHLRRRRRGDQGDRHVEFDSRAVTPGGLFLALPGARSDGHDFAAAAVAAGAVGVLAARPVGVPAIVVTPAPTARPTRRPVFWSTTPTAQVRRCSPHWPGWPPRWPPSWWRAA